MAARATAERPASSLVYVCAFQVTRRGGKYPQRHQGPIFWTGIPRKGIAPRTFSSTQNRGWRSRTAASVATTRSSDGRRSDGRTLAFASENSVHGGEAQRKSGRPPI